jgi:CheY-like chemotaxis protein
MSMPKAHKILVVDDDSDFTMFCQTVLSSKGFDVITASSGATALALVEAERPDLVILDVVMEQADTGFNVARKLHAARPDLPVLLLSTIAEAADLVFDISSLPVKGFLNKPIKPADLIRMAERYLG